MKNIKTYEDFCNENLTNEEINIRKALAGAALGAGLAFGSPAKGQTVTTPTTQTQQQDVKKDQVKLTKDSLNRINGYLGNFEWSKKDSVSKAKDKLYSDTKIFIANTWRSSVAVTETGLDDKENGIIIIKCASKKSTSWGTYFYHYKVTFRMKDNKFKIDIGNVYCDDVYMDGKFYQTLQPFDYEETDYGAWGKGDNYPETAPRIGKKQIIKMMSSLKNELESITKEYSSYIKTNVNTEW